MHFRGWTAVHWLVLLLAVAAILPEGRSQTTRKRKPPASRKCTMTVDEVDALTALLEDIEQEPTEESDETEAEQEVPAGNGTSTQCTQELTRLRNSVRRLQESYQKLKQDTDDVDVAEYRLRKNRYEQQKLDLTAKLNGLEQQVNSKHRSQINELRRKIKELEKQLNVSVTALEQQRQANAEHYINLVATQVASGRVSLAARQFEKLMKYTTDPYGEIMKQVQVSRNMMNFLKTVHFKHQPVAGYEVLVDAMIQRQSLRGWDAVDLLKHIQSLILARDGRQQERAVALLKKFKMNAV